MDREPHSHSLGPALKLGRLEIDPSPVTSGAPLSLTIQLIPDSAISIKEIALLIYSEYGERVAVLDLRQHGLRNLLLEDDPFEFRIRYPETCRWLRANIDWAFTSRPASMPTIISM